MKRTFVRVLSLEAPVVSSAGALLCLVTSLSGAAGCSQSSSGAASGADAATTSNAEGGSTLGTDAASPSPSIGDPVASCDGCPVCGGTLASATTGVSYCTEDCTTSATCPTGTACLTDPVSSQLSKQCLKTCAADSDCSGIFVCRSDIEDGGSVCWSPYPPRDAGTDASSAGADSGALDAGSALDAADASPVVAADSGSDAGPTTTPDASDSGSAD